MNNVKRLLRVLKQYPLAVICTVIILLCSVAIFIRGGAAMELSAQEAELNSRIQTINQNAKNAEDLQQELEVLEQLVEQTKTRLFDRYQRAVNINFFYGLEKRMDVRISNIGQTAGEAALYDKGGPRQLKLHSTINFDILLNGQFDEVLAFLYELYRVDPFIRVADVQMTRASKLDEGQGALDARLRVIVLAEKD